MTIHERIRRLEEARAIINEVRNAATSNDERANTLEVVRDVSTLIRNLDNATGDMFTGEDFAEIAFECAERAERDALAYTEAVQNGAEARELWRLQDEARGNLRSARINFETASRAGYEYFGCFARDLDGIENIIAAAEREHRFLYA